MAIGYFGRRLFRSETEPSTSSDSHNFLLSAALALLGLLIAFTFSMASTRYDARRDALLREANAVERTSLRFDIIEEPTRGKLSQDMLSYLDARQAFFAARADMSAVERADAWTNRVEERIWRTLTDWIRVHPENTSNASLMQATNAMFDLATTDRVEREIHVPAAITRAIAIYALIAAFLLGESSAARKDHRPFAATVVFVLVALSLTLIVDLDRPATGTITVSTIPFDRAAASIRAMEAGNPK
jgi:hypothetical protein